MSLMPFKIHIILMHGTFANRNNPKYDLDKKKTQNVMI